MHLMILAIYYIGIGLQHLKGPARNRPPPFLLVYPPIIMVRCSELIVNIDVFHIIVVVIYHVYTAPFKACRDWESWVDRVTRSEWYVIVSRRVTIMSAADACCCWHYL